MASGTVAPRLARRHRQKWHDALRSSGRLLLVAIVLLAVTVIPMRLLWWDTAVPAGIAAAVSVLILFGIVTLVPLEAIAYVTLYFDRALDGVRRPGLRSGRRLYRESGRLDAIAREAGLPPLSEFESADVLDTREAPVWHRPETALPTVEHLLARVAPDTPLHDDLRQVHAALRSASERRARFYLLLNTWAGMTNAELEARRRGEII